MKKIFQTIMNNFDVNEGGLYIDYFETKESLSKKKDELFDFNIQCVHDDFETPYISVEPEDDLHYPIIVFYMDGLYKSKVFDSKSTRKDILIEANGFFMSSYNIDFSWYFDEYNIFEETDVLRFETKEGDVLGAVMKNGIKETMELNSGADPMEEKWEDDVGNTISIDGWGNID